MSQPYYEGLGLLLFLVEVRVLQLSLVEQITSKSPSFRAAFKEIIFVQYCFFYCTTVAGARSGSVFRRELSIPCQFVY